MKECPSINTIRQKPGYSSQETERAPGATNSYSTADDINFSENFANFQLRFKRDTAS